MKTILRAFLVALMLVTAVQAELPVQKNVEEKDGEKAPIYLSYCMNFGQGVSYSFQSCVNNNFMSVTRVLGGFMPSCTNFGTEVDYFYTSCISRNFREVQRLLRNSIYLTECMNYDRTTLDGFYVMCVNQNYGQIQRAIEQL